MGTNLIVQPDPLMSVKLSLIGSILGIVKSTRYCKPGRSFGMLADIYPFCCPSPSTSIDRQGLSVTLMIWTSMYVTVVALYLISYRPRVQDEMEMSLLINNNELYYIILGGTSS